VKTGLTAALTACLLFISAPAISKNQTGLAGSTREVTLFFDNAGVLKPEIRDIPRNKYIEFEIRAVIEQLIGGSTNYGRTVPQNAKINRVFVDSRNIVYLDFNSRLIKDHPGGITCEILTVASITRTIFANFDTLGVQILSDGKEMETLAGHLDTKHPLTRGEVQKWINPKGKRRR